MFLNIDKTPCCLESLFHTIRSFSTHYVFLFKALQKKFMSSNRFCYCLAHVQALSLLPNFLPNLALLAPLPIFLCCNHASSRLLSQSFLFYNSGKKLQLTLKIPWESFLRVHRLEICHDRRDRRSCKIFPVV